MGIRESHLSVAANSLESDSARQDVENAGVGVRDEEMGQGMLREGRDEAASDAWIINCCAESYVRALMAKIKEENLIRNEVMVRASGRPFRLGVRNAPPALGERSVTEAQGIGEEQQAVVDLDRPE